MQISRGRCAAVEVAASVSVGMLKIFENPRLLETFEETIACTVFQVVPAVPAVGNFTLENLIGRAVGIGADVERQL